MDSEETNLLITELTRVNPGITASEIKHSIVRYFASLEEYQHQEGPHTGKPHLRKISEEIGLPTSTIHNMLNSEPRRKRNPLRPEVLSLDKVSNYYDSFGNLDAYLFDHADRYNPLFSLLKEVPEPPEHVNRFTYNEVLESFLLQKFNKAFRLLENRGLVFKREEYAPARVFSRTEKGSAVVDRYFD